MEWARAVAQPLDRWRHEREGEAFLDRRELPIELGGDLLGRARALAEGFEGKEDHAVIRRVGELQRVEAREGDLAGDAIGLVGQRRQFLSVLPRQEFLQPRLLPKATHQAVH